VTLLVRGATGDEVSRAWQGKTVVCIASGPSLTKDSLELVRLAREADTVRVIAVNDNYLVAPWADLVYFADHRWWKWHTEGIDKAWPWARFTAQEVREAFARFRGQKVTIKHDPVAKGPDIFTLKNDGGEGISSKPDAVRTGSNSGYQAMNIAILSGGNPVLLVGYDMRFHGSRGHSHNGHPLKMPEEAYRNYAKNFVSVQIPLAALGVRVVNCTPGSAITSFPHGDLEQELKAVA
jgi:hypothetical protein